MKGCEKAFIASVAQLPEVVALRVEGLDNIRFARMIAPEKFIIGLVKYSTGSLKGGTSITPTTLDGANIITAGADMVATGNATEFYDFGSGSRFVRRVMLDLGKENHPMDFFTTRMCTAGWESFLRYLREKKIVISTTYRQKAFGFVKQIKERYPFAKVNLEGGISTPAEIQKGFECGADWVTIGKAINDPPSIINSLMAGIEVDPVAEPEPWEFRGTEYTQRSESYRG
jgi:putative N-acetylmannosamine-6-phosphate epimerase